MQRDTAVDAFNPTTTRFLEAVCAPQLDLLAVRRAVQEGGGHHCRNALGPQGDPSDDNEPISVAAGSGLLSMWAQILLHHERPIVFYFTNASAENRIHLTEKCDLRLMLGVRVDD
eukprot:gene6987-4951_t